MSDIFNLTDTWNAGATTFTAIKMNVTDTASAAASLLMDLQVGGSSKNKTAKTGAQFGADAAAWTIPTLNSPGYLPPVLAYASESTSRQGMVLATASASGDCTLTLMASGGTLASPTAQAGAGQAINFMNYVGGSVAEWRTFAVIEAGNRGGAPTSEGDVLGRIQLGACNGAVGTRPGVVVYNDSVTVTNAVPLYMYNTGHANVFDGNTGDYERGGARWLTNQWIIGTAKGGTGATRFIQVECGNTAIAQIDTNVGFLFDRDYILGWSAAAGTLGTNFTAPDLRAFRSAAGVMTLDNGAGGFTALRFGTSGSAGSQNTLLVRKTGIADATATAIITVTVPNAAHNAAIFLDILGHLGTGTDASESSRCATGCIVLARTSGADTVATAATLDTAQIATVSGGGTLTLAYDVSSLTGASSATQTFTIRLTLTVTGTITDHTAVVSARLLNSLGTGVTIAAA